MASTRTRSANTIWNSIKFRTLSAKNTILKLELIFSMDSSALKWNNMSDIDIVVGEIGNYLRADCLD